MLIRFANFLAGLLVMTGLSQAVIVGGFSGLGNNNDDPQDLANYLSGASLPAFDYWDNLVRVADASGVYLGFNPGTQTSWVLAADHVSTPTKITVAGNSYDILNGIAISGPTIIANGKTVNSTDFKLYELDGQIVLPTIEFPSTVATNGETALMFGRAYTNGSTAPFTTVAPGTNSANGMRWGTNLIEGRSVGDVAKTGPAVYRIFVSTEFDDPDLGDSTEYEAQAAIGDSGGGLFVLRNGQWKLAGIGYGVNSETSGKATYGDVTYYSEVYHYIDSITAITGTLIPEPTSSLLGLLGLTFLGGIRRRRIDA